MTNKDIYIQFGIFVKEARLRKGLYQEEVAEQVGITQAHYSYIESGKRQATLTVALDICAALNLDFEEFLKTVKYKKAGLRQLK